MQWTIGMNSFAEGSSTSMHATPSNAFSDNCSGMLSRSLIISRIIDVGTLKEWQ